MRPLAVVLLTAAFGGVLGFVGFREFRRRRRLGSTPSNVTNPGSFVADESEQLESEAVLVRRQRRTSLRIRPCLDLSSVKIFFEFLMLLISLLLAWVLSPTESPFLGTGKKA